ncbi:MAG: toxin-activating lysine-acyltransferase [Filomicrobium sp.]
MFFGKKKTEPSQAATNNPAPAAQSHPELQAEPEPAPKTDGAAQPVATAPLRSSQPESVAAAQNAKPAGKHPLHVLGEITSLMAMSPTYREVKIVDLTWLITPALQTKQIAIAEARDATGKIRPAAGIVWAKVSAEVDRRLSEQATVPPQIKPDEWTSGDIPWIIMAIGTDKACHATISQLSKTRLNNQPVKILARGSDGKISARELAPAA